MKLHKLLLVNNACYKEGKTIQPKGIMIRSTGANNPNLRRYVGPDDGQLGPNTAGNHWNQEKPDGDMKCYHAFIGKLKDGSIATYQTLPWNRRAWHCKSGPNGSGNDTHITFSICEDDLKHADYFNAVYKEAVELCAFLCRMFGLRAGDVIDHSEGYKMGIASNAACVSHWFPKFGKTMDMFRADVDRYLNPGRPPRPPFPPYPCAPCYPPNAPGYPTPPSYPDHPITPGHPRPTAAYYLVAAVYNNLKIAQGALSVLKAGGFEQAYIADEDDACCRDGMDNLD